MFDDGGANGVCMGKNSIVARQHREETQSKSSKTRNQTTSPESLSAREAKMGPGPKNKQTELTDDSR